MWEFLPLSSYIIVRSTSGFSFTSRKYSFTASWAVVGFPTSNAIIKKCTSFFTASMYVKVVLRVVFLLLLEDFITNENCFILDYHGTWKVEKSKEKVPGSVIGTAWKLTFSSFRNTMLQNLFHLAFWENQFWLTFIKQISASKSYRNENFPLEDRFFVELRNWSYPFLQVAWH